MPDLTTELSLALATDNDDQADYLDLDTGSSLRTSLKTLDGLFNNATGHTHNGAHQGGSIGSIPASAIPDGSITSAKIADSGVATVDLADGAVTTPKIATGVTLTSPVLTTATLNSPTINTPTISGAVGGTATFGSGPRTTDWFRNETSGQGLFNDVAGIGIGIDASGAFIYPSGDRLVSLAAAQTLANKTLTSPVLNNPTDNNPTLNGTVGGTPTWASPQIFPPDTTLSGRVYLGNGAPPVNATVGFPMIPFMGGAPTGVPNLGPGGRAPLVYDNANHRLWIYDSAWHYVQFT